MAAAQSDQIFSTVEDATSCFRAVSASRSIFASDSRLTWAISSVWVSLRPTSARHVDSMPERQHPKRPAGTPSPKAMYQPGLSCPPDPLVPEINLWTFPSSKISLGGVRPAAMIASRSWSSGESAFSAGGDHGPPKIPVRSTIGGTFQIIAQSLEHFIARVCGLVIPNAPDCIVVQTRRLCDHANSPVA